MILSSLTKISQNRPNNKLKFCENQLKKVDFRKNLDPIWNLVLKRVSKFVIPQFRDTLLVPKIIKCEDLLYKGVIMKRSQLGSERVFKHDHSIFDVFYGFAIREFFFGIWIIIAKLCRSTLSYYVISLEVSLL